MFNFNIINKYIYIYILHYKLFFIFLKKENAETTEQKNNAENEENREE
jgi:hypothetical protein